MLDRLCNYFDFRKMVTRKKTEEKEIQKKRKGNSFFDFAKVLRKRK